MTVLSDLARLSSAEDFFAYLDVPYDPQRVAVARLHILRKMGDYLRAESPTDDDDTAARTRCKAQLERAYADFVTASPLEHRVFKVLKQAVEPTGGAFVPLTALTTTAKERQS